jgi:glucokinase
MEAAEHTGLDYFALGVNIGGAHIMAAVVDIRSRTVLPETMENAFVNAQGTAEEILESWYRLIDTVLQKSPVPLKNLGMAVPGPFNYQEGVSLIRHMKKYDALYGINIKEYLAQKLSLEQDNIRMRNNAEAFLAGEMMNGVAHGYTDVVAVALGTGIGTARSNNGLAEGVSRGSNIFREGVAEDYLSSRWLMKRYQELSGEEIRSIKELLAKDPEDKAVHQLLVEFSNNLALFLGGFIQAEKPQVVVVGGKNAPVYDLVHPMVVKLLERHLDKVEIRKAVLGEDAVLIGAVSYWIKQYRLLSGLPSLV